jgi:hypothetical protein
MKAGRRSRSRARFSPARTSTPQLHSLSVKILLRIDCPEAPSVPRPTTRRISQERYARAGGLVPKLWRKSTSPMRHAIAERENLSAVRDRSRKILCDDTAPPENSLRTAIGEKSASAQIHRARAVRRSACQPRDSNGFQRSDNRRMKLRRSRGESNPLLRWKNPRTRGRYHAQYVDGSKNVRRQFRNFKMNPRRYRFFRHAVTDINLFQSCCLFFNSAGYERREAESEVNARASNS